MKQLKKQIEKIIDEGSGERRSVILHVGQTDPASEKFINIATEVYSRRNLTVSARDLLPASRNDLRNLEESAGKELTPQIKAIMNLSAASLSVGIAAMAGVGIPPLVATPIALYLLKSGLLRKAIGEAAAAKGIDKVDESQLTTFSSSKSAVLDISKNDLAKLPEEDLQIKNIFPNRTLKLPSLVEVKNIPLAVQENKGSSWGINKIGALSAWGAYNARGKGVKIALLDTGVDKEHPDLRGKIGNWAEFDRNGKEVPNSQAYDSDRHGTHCAGTLVGGNASGSWIGVAPEAELFAALVLKGKYGTDAQILAGIEWAIQQKVDVISMSLGGVTLDWEVPDSYTEAIISALVAGIPVVTAIGNEGNQTTGTPGNDYFALSVGATDYRDLPAGFSGGRSHVITESNYIARENLPLVYSKPELSAPGVAINSSIPGNEWSAFNGTSMATPHVAGAIALLLSSTNICNAVSGAERAFLIQDLITGTVEEIGESGIDHRYGFGRIDVLRAIGMAKEMGY